MGYYYKFDHRKSLEYISEMLKYHNEEHGLKDAAFYDQKYIAP